MDVKRLGLGLGAFVAGAAAWTWGAGRWGDRVATLFDRDPATGPDGAVVPGDSTTSPIAPRAATMVAAPVGMAETEKHLPRGERNPAAEHAATDLQGATPPDAHARAPEVFRPDPTAVPSAAEREALRPATGPAPTLVADRGSGFSEAAGAA